MLYPTEYLTAEQKTTHVETAKTVFLSTIERQLDFCSSQTIDRLRLDRLLSRKEVAAVAQYEDCHELDPQLKQNIIQRHFPWIEQEKIQHDLLLQMSLWLNDIFGYETTTPCWEVDLLADPLFASSMQTTIEVRWKQKGKKWIEYISPHVKRYYLSPKGDSCLFFEIEDKGYEYLVNGWGIGVNKDSLSSSHLASLQRRIDVANHLIQEENVARFQRIEQEWDNQPEG